MSDTKRYQVLTACAVVPAFAGDGTESIYTLLQGNVFEANPQNLRIVHNVESGYIAEIGADAAAGVDGAGTPLVDDEPTVGDGEAGAPVEPNDPGRVNEAAHAAAEESRANTPERPTDVNGRRIAAQQKLADAGGKPKDTHGKDVWVEHLVTRGYEYNELTKQGKDELVKLAKQNP